MTARTGYNTGRRIGLAVAMVATALALGGCGVGRIEQPDAKLGPEPASPALLDQISQSRTVSEHQAVAAMIYLLEGKDGFESFGQRVDHLRALGVVPNAWDFRADRPVTRGRVAYMLYHVCKLTGGLTLTLRGPSERYCLREMQYRGFVGTGAVFVEVSGMEMIACIGRADAYLQNGEVPEVLSTEGS